VRTGGQTLRRIAAAILAAGVVALAAIEATRAPQDGGRPGGSAAPSADPLTAEISRCAALGEAALQDDACRRAWTEHRRRFLGLDPGQSEVRP
jgi:conjugative transfer region protein TrbK